MYHSVRQKTTNVQDFVPRGVPLGIKELCHLDGFELVVSRLGDEAQFRKESEKTFCKIQ